jgi:hypothetical protein
MNALFPEFAFVTQVGSFTHRALPSASALTPGA